MAQLALPHPLEQSRIYRHECVSHDSFTFTCTDLCSWRRVTSFSILFRIQNFHLHTEFSDSLNQSENHDQHCQNTFPPHQKNTCHLSFFRVSWILPFPSGRNFQWPSHQHPWSWPLGSNCSIDYNHCILGWGMCKFAPWTTKGLVEVSKRIQGFERFLRKFGGKKRLWSILMYFFLRACPGIRELWCQGARCIEVYLHVSFGLFRSSPFTAGSRWVYSHWRNVV